jgi:hypothetical protein
MEGTVDLAFPLEGMGQAEYLEYRAEELQRKTVTFQLATTRTNDTRFWPFRNTTCDVISIITTTTEAKNGKMKDIRLQGLKPANIT